MLNGIGNSMTGDSHTAVYHYIPVYPYIPEGDIQIAFQFSLNESTRMFKWQLKHKAKKFVQGFQQVF